MYVIHGDEPLFVCEAQDAIRAKAHQEGILEREIFIAERGFKWDALFAAYANLGLFGDKKLIDLRIPNGKPDSEGAALLMRIAQDAAADIVTMVTLPRLDGASQRSEWFTVFKEKAQVIDVFPIDRESLPRFIESRASPHHITFTPAATQFLADRSEGNLLSLHQELQKLALLFPEGTPTPLTPEHIEQTMTDAARYSIYDLSAAWLLGDTARALRMISSLKSEGEAPTLMAWQFAEDVHLLSQIRAETFKGVSARDAVMRARVWGNRQKAMEHAVRFVPNATISALIKRLADLDAAAKGQKTAADTLDFWQVLTDAVLLLTKKP
jgi:DNA polymerase-3 subunit delta